MNAPVEKKKGIVATLLPLFTPLDLGVTIAALAPINRPRHQQNKKKTGNIAPLRRI